MKQMVLLLSLEGKLMERVLLFLEYGTIEFFVDIKTKLIIGGHNLEIAYLFDWGENGKNPVLHLCLNVHVCIIVVKLYFENFPRKK